MSPSPDRNLKSQLRLLAGQAATTAVITDIDGTICPIVPRPNEAEVPEPTRKVLECLSKRFHTVALISGRSTDDMFAMVPLSGLVMAGNHGMEWRAADESYDTPLAAPYRPLMQVLAEQLGREAGDGVLVQPKGLSVSLHYRLAPDPATARARILEIVGPLTREHGLRVQEGRLVVDLRPDISVDKGTALAEIVSRPGVSRAVMWGDDLTDVAAFERLRELRNIGRLRQGFSVAVVGDEESPQVVQEAADFQVPGPAEAVRMLEELLRTANSSASLS